MPCTRRTLIAAFCCSVVVFVTYAVIVEPLVFPDALDMVAVYSSHTGAIFNHAWTAVKSRYNLPRDLVVDKREYQNANYPCYPTSPPENTFIQRQQKIQHQRRHLLQQACHQYLGFDQFSATKMKKTPEVAFLLENYHLLYAQTAKIAGTSWDRVLLVLNGVANSTSQFGQSETIDLTKITVPRLENYKHSDRSFILSNFTTFMFTRHPFSRLLSAYHCKVGPDATEEHVHRGFYDLLRKRIQKKYQRTKPDGIPNFRDFAQYLVDTNSFSDPHWKENYKIVSPCDVDYDVIGHFETLEEDARYILTSVGADCLVEFPTSEGSAATNSSHTDTLVEHYKDLPRDLLEGLYERYKLDFLLFGYSFEVEIDGEMLQLPPPIDVKFKSKVTHE
ncbi:carbohydrate sulfotransferase 10-like isoform X1 [Amphiura filiformis]|uniref:carbohydrate sulfotransferase 10-like isoform X1 n=1 Tax=Amphiura filiformis TaxID=82378 RepID=UPI003B214446